MFGPDSDEVGEGPEQLRALGGVADDHHRPLDDRRLLLNPARVTDQERCLGGKTEELPIAERFQHDERLEKLLEPVLLDPARARG